MTPWLAKATRIEKQIDITPPLSHPNFQMHAWVDTLVGDSDLNSQYLIMFYNHPCYQFEFARMSVAVATAVFYYLHVLF